METNTKKVEKAVGNKVITSKKIHKNDEGIVLPALLWWMGVPIGLLLILWLVGIL